MLRSMAENWWVLALRGIVAIIFGILAFVMPGITLVSLVLLFGVYAIIDGISALVGGWRARGRMEWWWALLINGILGILAGIAAFLWPGMTALVLLYIIAFWAIARGIFDILSAIQLRKVIDNEWYWILSGIAAIALGVLLLVNPGAGALAGIFTIGGFAILTGILLIAVAWRLRGLNES